MAFFETGFFLLETYFLAWILDLGLIIALDLILGFLEEAILPFFAFEIAFLAARLESVFGI